jgi:hypothetical protein
VAPLSEFRVERLQCEQQRQREQQRGQQQQWRAPDFARLLLGGVIGPESERKEGASCAEMPNKAGSRSSGFDR